MMEYFKEVVMHSDVPDEVKDHVEVGLHECHLTEPAVTEQLTRRLLRGVVRTGAREYVLDVDVVEQCVVNCTTTRK